MATHIKFIILKELITTLEKGMISELTFLQLVTNCLAENKDYIPTVK